jgi:histidine kinase
MLSTEYEFREELVRRPSFVLSSGYRRSDRRPVLLKYPGAIGPGSTDALPEREHRLLRSLSLPGVPKPIDFIDRPGQSLTVFEDLGHRPLANQRPGGLALSLQQFLDLAISLCTIVDGLHRREVTHRQIQPRQIFQHPETGELTLFCFAFATAGHRDDFDAPAIPPIADLLAYASPELTGRMNLPVDYRTDFYSLGMTFYELLTGRLPFSSNDSLEIVHWHIAGSGIPPHEVDGQIPVLLSELVMKLLSKDPAKRYQSALGLRADLERFRRDRISGKRFSAFPLAQDESSITRTSTIQRGLFRS